LAFQVAKQQRQAVTIREPVEFGVKEVAGFAPSLIDARWRSGHVGFPEWAGSPLGVGAKLDCDPVGDSVQPRAECVLPVGPTGPADEDQESCLKGVVNVVGVGQNSPHSDADQSSVTTGQRFERGLVPLRQVTAE
jgi:hypothetical protein